MKKQALLFMAGTALIAASCNQPADSGMSDAQIDSMVNARVETIRAEMMAQNDSLIDVMAQMKADSIIAAMGSGSKTGTARKTSKPSVRVTPAEPATTAPTTPKASDRPGATNQGEKKASDRPGATNQGEKKASDRPGAR